MVTDATTSEPSEWSRNRYWMRCRKCGWGIAVIPGHPAVALECPNCNQLADLRREVEDWKATAKAEAEGNEAHFKECQRLKADNERLREAAAKVYAGHELSNVHGADWCVTCKAEWPCNAAVLRSAALAQPASPQPDEAETSGE